MQHLLYTVKEAIVQNINIKETKCELNMLNRVVEDHGRFLDLCALAGNIIQEQQRNKDI